MKRLLAITLVSLLTIMVGVATAGSKKDVVKYEVRVEIVYNALTPDEMGKVMEKIGEDNAGACTVKFNVKKLGDNILGTDITLITDGYSVTGTTSD